MLGLGGPISDSKTATDHLAMSYKRKLEDNQRASTNSIFNAARVKLPCYVCFSKQDLSIASEATTAITRGENVE